MRRILTTALASSLLALAIPAAASAHHGSHHRHHRRHHAHTVVFTPSARRADTPSGTQTPTMPTEQVATVASFEGGVLKLTLADGSTVSGKVTENTEIQCGCDGHHFDEGPQGFGNDNGNDNGDENSPGFSHHDDEQGQMGEENCGVSSLVAGAKVKEAELNVSGAGAFWEKIELVPQS